MENERCVIGALCLDPDDAPDALTLSPEDFTGQHRDIYKAAMNLYHQGVKPDLVSLTNELMKTGQLAAIGGAGYLGELADYVPTVANTGYYVKKVREKSQRRRLKALAESIQQNSETMPIAELLERAEKAIDGVRGKSSDAPKSISLAISQAMKNLESRNKRKGEIPGAPCGLPSLDNILGGLQGGKFYIIAGRPGMGKSALALDISRSVAKDGKTVLFFSLEMGADELGERALSSEGHVDNSRLRFGNLANSDWPRLQDAAGTMHETTFFIDDSPVLTAADIRSKAKQIKRKHDLGLVIVDYLQLIDGSGSRYDIVTDASRQLKLLSKEVGCPVVALCQLNRGLENRDDKRPKLADLRESGALEQDADVILFTYREAVYCDCKGMAECKENHKRDAQIIVGKHRGGPCGVVNCSYIGEHTTFTEAI